MSEVHRLWAEIDPSAIRHNAEFAILQTGAGLMAVVKANAYGHGVEIVVPALEDIAALFAVANVEEAVELKSLCPEKNVLLLSPCLPSEREVAIELGCIATISSASEARAYSSAASAGRPAVLQIKVDTGMGRIGSWHTEALDEIRRILELPNVQLHDVATHLPVADEDDAFTRGQLEGFSEFARIARKIAPATRVHALNSAGICVFSKYSFDLVRAGLLLYGSSSVAGFQQQLRPALAWKTRILLIREVPAGRTVSYGRTYTTEGPTRIATLAVGYADGYPRQVSGKPAYVLVGGRRCPVLGRVTMDQIMVDISRTSGVETGDEVVLIGKQGDERIHAAELAEWADTIAWDIFTGIRGRTKRFAI